MRKFYGIIPSAVWPILKISGWGDQVPPEDLNPRQVIIIKPGERIPVMDRDTGEQYVR